MSKYKTIRTTMAFSEKEKDMVEQMCQMMGCNPSELFRGWLREKYMKVFPPYRTAKVVMDNDQLTAEQLCERAGGVIKVKDGLNVCVIKVSESMNRVIPLDRPDLIPKKK